MLKKTAKPFATEVELCARFLSAVGPEWTAYAETAGWDILLVRNSDGFQIGIEAKLKLNAHVISQALEEYSHYAADHPGPDCRAILVPADESGPLGRIAAYIGLTVIRVNSNKDEAVFQPKLPKPKNCYVTREEWYEWAPSTRHKLPEYVPDVAAGAPAPTQLTDWKIAAIKIAVTLEQRGFVTRSDFKHIGIDHRRWIAAETRWLHAGRGGYVAGTHFPDFKLQHPTVYEQIKADAPKWMSKELALL